MLEILVLILLAALFLAVALTPVFVIANAHRYVKNISGGESDE